MRIGPQDRGGFTPLANAENDRLFNMLTPEQFRLYVGLRVEAQYGEAAERRDSFGRAIHIEPGEVLFSIDGCAWRYRLARDQVRRAVDRFEKLGLVTRRPGAVAATPPGLVPATPRGPETATPPTVLTFLTDREKCWRATQTAIPTGVVPATRSAPRQPPSNQINQNNHTNQTASGERSATPPSPQPPAWLAKDEQELEVGGPSLPGDAPPLAAWLVEHYPDVTGPVKFARVQAEANPGIDLLAEARRAYAWETADATRRKHKHARFLASWFARAQDGGARHPVAANTPHNQSRLAPMPATPHSVFKALGGGRHVL